MRVRSSALNGDILILAIIAKTYKQKIADRRAFSLRRFSPLGNLHKKCRHNIIADRCAVHCDCFSTLGNHRKIIRTKLDSRQMRISLLVGRSRFSVKVVVVPKVY